MATKVQLSAVGSEAKTRFARDGWAIVEGALSAQQCEQWRQEALAIVQRHALHVDRTAGGSRLHYGVVLGDVICKQWPELFEFYTSEETLLWMRGVTGATAIYTSPYVRSAVNINVLSVPGEMYPWHFDVTPYTLLLFLTTSTVGDGGALDLLSPEHSQEISVLPRAGDVVVMDGTRCRHRVREILRPHLRVSIPFVFPPTPTHHRRAELDEYLYSEDASVRVTRRSACDSNS